MSHFSPQTRSFLRAMLLLPLGAASVARAIIIRDDVDDAKYLVPPSEFPALADIPEEGHGVLIAPQWIVTAAHAVTWQSGVCEVSLNHLNRKVERVVLHPGFKKLPQDLIDEALKTGDSTRVMSFLAASDDLALIKLAAPVTDVAPVPLYRASDELGKTVKLIGKGATSTGALGQEPHAPHRTQLRRAFNVITRAEDRWLCYLFDKPPAGLPLEGITGDGDSGGPLLINVKGHWQLAGVASWKDVRGNIVHDRTGSYGQTNYGVRLSHYAAWIDGVIGGAPAHAAAAGK